MRYTIPSILVFFFLISLGCQDAAIIDSNATSETKRSEASNEEKTDIKECYGDTEAEISSISSDVLVKAYYHPSCEDKMVFHSKTEKEYSTGGYVLASSFCQEGKTLKVQYHSVIEPSGPVTTALAPALGEIKIPKLDDGVYRITFSLDNQVSTGNLIVSNDKVKLELKEGNVRLWNGE